MATSQDNDPLALSAKTKAVLDGQYTFDIRALLQEGWALTQRSKSVLIQIGLVTFACALVLYIVLLQGFGVTDYANVPLRDQFGMNLVLMFLLAPLMAALMLVATRNASGLHSNFGEWSRYLPWVLPLGVTAILSDLLIKAGLFVFILPGIYLKIATGFALLLVAEKQMGPVQAIWLSIRVVNRYWLHFIGLYLIFACMAVVIGLTFGVALIWLGPLYLHIKGILYRDMFGLSEHAEANNQGDNNHESVFRA